MFELGAPPLTVRRELTENLSWGNPGHVRRFELSTGEVSIETKGAGCRVTIHGQRASLMADVRGGHPSVPWSELAAQIVARGRGHVDADAASPDVYVEQIVSWLERERTSGLLARAYTTALLVVVLSETEVLVWQAGAYAVVVGTSGRMEFRSTDLRYPVLRKLGAMPPSTSTSPELERGDRVRSLCCVGAPRGYETLVCPLATNGVLIALDAHGAPYGPWPSAPMGLAAIWRMDAAWLHGQSASAIAITRGTAERLELPRGWSAREIDGAASD